MSSFDKVRMTFPGGSPVFEASVGINVQTQQTPQWLFDGLTEVFAATDQINGSSGDLTEQVFLGAGSKIRTFNVQFTQRAGSQSNTWGNAGSGDITQKMQELDHALATNRITSDATAELEFGEYSSAGTYAPVDVVPGKTDLSVDFSEETGAFTSSVAWIDALDVSQILDVLP